MLRAILISSTLLFACNSASFSNAERKVANKGDKKASDPDVTVEGDVVSDKNDTDMAGAIPDEESDGNLDGENDSTTALDKLGENASTAEVDTAIEIDEEILRTTCAESGKEFSTKMTFPAQTNSCAWNQNDNGPKEGATPSARSEQVMAIDLPGGVKKVCSIKFRSANSQVQYDDSMIFSMQDLIMASNGFTKTRFETQLATSKGGLFELDFLKLKHRGYDKHVLLCADGVVCQIPQSETSGLFNLEVGEKWFSRANLFQKDSMPSKLDVKVVVTGNKQSSDCNHSGVAFDIDVRYLEN